MNDRAVFNHHCLPFDSPFLAEAAIPDFLRLCFRARNAGLQVILVDETGDPTWFGLELAPGYSWRHWHERHSQSGGNRDLVRAFRSIATQRPFFDDRDLDRGCYLIDVRLPDSEESLAALLAAVWHEAPLIGFPTRAPWNASPVGAIVVSLDEAEGMHEEPADIVNLCSLDAWEIEEPKTRARRTTDVRSGKALLAQWSTLYPFLSYCGKVPEQLVAWSHGLSILEWAKEALEMLNLFSEKWRDREIAAYSHAALRELGLNHEVSGESASVRNDPSLRACREFWLPSGEKAYFEEHVKLSQGYRLHFYPDPMERAIFIGYIGKHLPLP